MSSFTHTLFFFIIALVILIAVHEYGHYWMARRLGVRVLRFSLGFGKIIWRHQRSPRDTEFTLSALPLGGYVKMVDEREAEVDAADLPYAFNRKPVASRAAIVLAGPVFNFLLAVLIYWVGFMWGETSTRPVLGEVRNGTIAQLAGFREGDEILSVDGRRTPAWNLAIGDIMAAAMDETPIQVVVKSVSGEERDLVLKIPMGDNEKPDLLYKKIGLRPWEPDIDPVVDRVEPGSAAESAGLLPGDRIVSADGIAMPHWRQWLDHVRARPGEPIKAVVDRNGMRVGLTFVPAVTESVEGRIGRIGMAVRVPEDLMESMKVVYRLGFLPALGAALEKTADYSLATLKMAGRMLMGRASVENLSGPISIAQYAGKSASYGVAAFLHFLALVSISLGVLNLLPIPVLDGGHLMFYLVEAVKGSPLSEQAQAVFQQIGMFVLLCLMALGFYLDIGRLFSS